VTLAPEVGRPTAVPSARAPWFVRPFQARTFTPAELRSVNAATVIPFPDVAARRRMTRGERLAWGGALLPVVPLSAGASSAPTAPGAVREEAPPVRGDRPVVAAPAAPVAPADDALRDEIAAEVGTAAAALPIDLVDVVAHAWRAFRRGRDP
jgi:hypothetical protein